MRKFILSVFLLSFSIISMAQLQPMLNLKTDDKSKGEYGSDINYGFLPFRGKSQLRNVFNGEEGDVSNALKELQYTSIALSVDSINTNSIYVELLSFIPTASLGRFSFGSQLSQSDIPRDTNNIVQEDALKTIAQQKLLNGGGSFSLSLSRPLLFWASQSCKSYFISNAGVICYADIDKFNSSLYKPGLGSQFNFDFDLRLFSNGSEIMIGNLFRIGARGRFMYNAFDAKYQRTNNIADNLNNLAIFVVSGYIGIGPVFIEFGTSTSNKAMYRGNNNLFRFSLQPVKW